MLVTVEGIYQNGQIHLSDKVPFDDAKKVIVTFLNEPIAKSEKVQLQFDNFSFKKTREALKNYKGSFSDDLVNERRQSLWMFF